MAIGTKLTLSYLLIIAAVAVVFSLVGVQLIGQLIVAEAQTAVRNDLNAARVILEGRLDDINDVIRLTADRLLLQEALQSGEIAVTAGELTKVARHEHLDFLTLADATGRVLVRTDNPGSVGDDLSANEFLATVRRRHAPVAAVTIMTAPDLRRESPPLAVRALVHFVPTPRARERPEHEETAGMVLAAAAPVLGAEGRLLGTLYGGVLLNGDFDIVDKVKSTVFQNVRFRNKDIGTATIFLDDVRISTNVLNEDGSRAIGTRAAADVYQRVVRDGIPWIGRAFVVNDWYITAYEPLHDLSGRTIGMHYVGILAEKYAAARRRAVGLFLSITLAGSILAVVVAHQMARRISEPLHRLVSAAQEMTHGNLDVRVPPVTNDELQDLAEAFNAMALSLQKRDQQLREYAEAKFRAERLAVIGHLATGVAHELNNPLQGVLTYTHLLLERVPADSPHVSALRKIADQTERCRQIIRGLLDFARPRTPQLKACDVNTLLRESMGIVEKQSLFHNVLTLWRLQPKLPAITLDPSEMQSVFVNLLVNAAEAMDGMGKLTVHTSFDGAEQILAVAVTDTGRGIPPEALGRVFDPFFTTKPPGRGVGLGLSICYGIVKEHGGTITVQSEVGRGTTFTVRLPVRHPEGA